MERILYFDCFSGISGDMCLGALVDVGVPKEYLINELKKLKVDGFELKIEKTQKDGITGTDAEVILHNHSHHHHHEDARNLNDIVEIIEKSEISVGAKKTSKEIFREIAEAEAKVHGKSIDEIHFHEVGAVDSIVDIVGVSICLDYLKLDKIFCGKITEGSGFIECAHGTLPVPVPAVMQMSIGSKLVISQSEVKGELITPSGMGILKVVATPCENMPEMNVLNVGYGFGKRDTGRFNGLRIILGECESVQSEGQFATDTVCVIETNIDDATGENLGFAMEELMKEGALDVSYSPILMKKNRPAYKLTVLCCPADLDKMSEIVLKQTTAIGVRIRNEERITLYRENIKIDTKYGIVNVKHSFSKDKSIEKFTPEYEDVAKISSLTGTTYSAIIFEIQNML